MLEPQDTVAVMEAIQRISSQKMNVNVSGYDAERRRAISGRASSSSAATSSRRDVIDRFGNSPLDPDVDPDIVGPDGHLHPGAEYDGRRRIPQDGRGDEDGDRAATPARARSPWAATTITARVGRPARSAISAQASAWARASNTRAANRRRSCCMCSPTARCRRATRSTTRPMGAASSCGSATTSRPLPRSSSSTTRPDVRALYTGASGPIERASAARLLPCERRRRDRVEPRGEQRQPARADRRAQLHGAARRAGSVRDPFPGSRSRQHRPDDRLQSDPHMKLDKFSQRRK